MAKPKEIFVRFDRCTGCHTCEIACSIEHSESKSLYGAISEHPKPKKRVYVEWVAPSDRVPVFCRHCEDAPCIHACISGAISRSEEGVVLSNSEKCIGCWTCVMVCPYGVIGRHLETHKAYRCDRCPDLETPACVDACPTKALVYRTVEAFSGEVRQTASREMLSGEKG